MSFDSFNTEIRMSAEVIRGRAFAEILVPAKRNYVSIEKIAVDGTKTLLADGFNSRTNMGAAWQASIMGVARGGPANYVALSTATLSPSGTDTTLLGEITIGDGTNSGGVVNTGLARALGTFQNPVQPTIIGGPASYQIANVFLSSATSSINSAALFDNITGGNLFVEANLNNPVILESGDQIVLTWTIQI